MPSIFTTTLAALAVAPLAMGHTWIEQLRNVDAKGNYVGEYGYPRGMISKTDEGYTGDSMNWLLPVQPKVFIDNTSPLCHTSQTKQEQSSDKYPRLQAVAGGFIAMRYMENGHVTMVDPATGLGKPEKGGTVFVYGTTTPKEDEKLVDVLKWTQDGSGGDARGALLAANDFDDGRCYEVNNTPTSQERRVSDPNFAMGQVADGEPGNYPLFCETNVQVPKNVTQGKAYTVYWVWQWNTAPNVDPGLPDGKDQYYTTCIDVDIGSADTALAADAESKYALGPQQDAMSIAVADFASRTAIMTDPLQGEVGPIFGSATATGAPATSGAPANSSSALSVPVASPTAPALTQVTNIPTMTSRPSAAPAPTSSAGDDNAVTVTDIVYITVTAGASSKSALAPTTMITTGAATSTPVASAPVASTPAASPVSSAVVSGTAPSSALGGFTMPSGAAKREILRKNGAKFRGML
ncbi:uncharacterized protein M421DRAFT_418864 [Didymella exigua CBS 183.55]|uniref:DUF7492 domain-containing protein n=1 Tax=Didymella exigua CBS 183.55 TaxID=1150837 RepID=A0A6A5RS29_9PLEO|nr:uncharacterized protein M421DRAFT_418864 [Didymella exigua CBS 183.55]KAF1930562.1 hypothetical protein M421DRAFT_418864 [Didymella exigua CBS 183.55]